MPTPAQIRTAVDSKLADLWTKILNKQTAYLAAKGRYWQGKRTHSIIPAEGDETACDRLADKPTDVQETWAAFLGVDLPATLPMLLFIDAYQSPAGHGFVATVYIRGSGQTWRRSRNQGPEAYRTRAWERVA